MEPPLASLFIRAKTTSTTALIVALAIAVVVVLLMSCLTSEVNAPAARDPGPAGSGDFVTAGLPLTNGQAATLVLGQSDFTQSYCYDGGPNPPPTSTSLCNPDGMAFDSSGNLWVADASDNRVLEYTPPFSTDEAANIVIGQAGPTASTCAISATNLCGPFDLAFDSSGDLWVADTQNNRVLEYVPGTSGCYAGQLCTGMAASVVIGQSTFTTNYASASSTALWGPQGIAFDPSGNLWVSDFANNRVLEYVPGMSGCSAGQLCTGMAASTVIGQSDFTTSSPATTSMGLDGPTDLAFDSSGDLWVTDVYNNRVLEYSPGTSECEPNQLCTGMAASVVIGQSTFTTDSAATSATGLDYPWGVGFDSSGDLWVADFQNNRVLEYTAGSLSTDDAASFVIGQPDLTSGGGGLGSCSAPTSTGLCGPRGVAFDSSSNLWVSDWYDNRVLAYGPSIALSKTSGPVGDTVAITGSGFDSSDSSVTISSIPEGAIGNLASCQVADEAIGSCSFTVTAPSGSSIMITATGNEGGSGDTATTSIPFTVTTPDVSLSKTSGPVGDTVAITGSGFDSSDTSLTISSNPVGAIGSLASCLVTDQVIGTCSFTVTGPSGSSIMITATGNEGGPGDMATTSIPFTVTTPSISLSKTSGPVGDTVAITGSGFDSSDTSLTISSSPVGAIGSLASCPVANQVIGSCSFTVTAPSGSSIMITATGNEGGSGDMATTSTPFTVTTPSISLSAESGPIGDTVTITGGGFDSSDTSLTVSSNPGGAIGSPESCAVANQVIGSCSFTVAGPSGTYAISVTGSGGANDYATASFMVSTPMITLSPATGPNGATVTASGSGFTPGVAVTFSITSGGLISSAIPCSVNAMQTFSDCTFTVTGIPATSYTISAEGSDFVQVPADAASTPFMITALTPPAGGTLFAKLPLPVGLAVNSTSLLATELNDCNTIFSISSKGAVSTFATIPTLKDGACQEAYLAISPGFAFFPKGEVFLTQGPYIYEVGPTGGTMTLFATISAFESDPGQATGITFDTIGTFGFNMVVTGGAGGTIESISYTAAQTVIGTVGYPVQGPAVAPLSFGSYGGDLLVGTGTSNTIIAVSPTGAVVTVSSWPGAGSVSIVPTTTSTCSYDGTDPYFVADESAGAVYAFPSSEVASLAGDALVTSDSSVNPSGIAEVLPTGAASSFSASKDLLPGSMFAFCPVWGLEAVIPNAGVDPYEMGYDPVNGLMYASDHATNLVYLFSSVSVIVGSITVGTDPAGIVYNPVNNEMLVANTGSNSVTFINAKTNVVLGSVNVGHGPQGLAYDPYNLEVYVANEASNSLSVIAPFNKVIATISTGSEPFGVAFNPLPLFIGSIYTANMGGSSTIIIGSKVTTLTLPCAATNIAEDFANGEMYVDDYGCSEVSLILGTKIVTSVGVGADPFGVAFDPKTGFMYVSNNGMGTLSVLNGTKTVITVFLGYVPYGLGVTYDPANALVYVAGGDPRPITGGDT